MAALAGVQVDAACDVDNLLRPAPAAVFRPGKKGASPAEVA